MHKIKIGTRSSRLALWQAQFVADELRKFYPTLEVEFVEIKTTGDKILDKPLATIGGKGLFTQELESLMIAGEIDLAVHSLKDVPTELPTGFKIAAVTRRTQPFDALISNKFSSLQNLPRGAIIGSSSLRRAAQLLALRPDLRIKNLRGNVETRLKKLDLGNFDAIILAAAGLERLGYSTRITEMLTELIPAAGQGALAIEICKDNEKIFRLVQYLNDTKTSMEVKVERDFLQKVGGSCQIPVGVFADIHDEKIYIQAIIASPDGQNVVKKKIISTLSEISTIGKNFAQNMLECGGQKILNSL